MELVILDGRNGIEVGPGRHFVLVEFLAAPRTDHDVWRAADHVFGVDDPVLCRFPEGEI